MKFDMRKLRTIRGLLILRGLLTSNSIQLYGKVKSVALYVFAIAILPFAKGIERLLKSVTALKALSGSRFTFAERRGVFGAGEGIAIVIAGIFIAVFLYVIAFTVPQALTAIATAALVSVSSGPQTLFQTLLSIIAVITLILIILGVAKRASE